MHLISAYLSAAISSPKYGQKMQYALISISNNMRDLEHLFRVWLSINYTEITLKTQNEHLPKGKRCSIFTDKKGFLQKKVQFYNLHN